jgi:AraC family transcriptional regulator, ethanolamine operon transcriptional activator
VDHLLLDYDVHAAALRERGIHLILTSRSRADWSFEKYQLERLVIEFRTEGGSAIAAGRSPADAIVFAVLSSASSDDNLFNGQKIRALDLIVIPPGQQVIQTACGPHQWTFAILAAAGLPLLEPSLGDALGSLLDVRRALVLRSRTLARRVVATTAGFKTMTCEGTPAPGSGVIREIENALTATLSAAAMAALERARRSPDLSRGRGASSYELALRAAGVFHSSALMPQGIEDFCIALGATERKIRRSFNSFFGMGPARLAKLHQLNRVRRMLVESIPNNAKVMSVLSACDVTEFGRFAGEYKAIFGEKPSDTLKRHVTID